MRLALIGATDGGVEGLREFEEQFRRAIEDAPIPVIMHAEDGEVLQISRTWTELTGYTLADIPTVDAWLNHAYGDGADAVRNHVQALFTDDRRTLDVAFDIRTRKGELRHWSFSASSPGTLRDGRRFIVGMAVDITERKRAEMALAEQARLLDLSNDAIIVRDVNNRILYWNRGATELYGWRREEAIGKDLHTLLRTEFEAPLEQLIATLRERDRMEGEVIQVTRDGRRITLLCRWALDRDALGQPGAILTTYNDITERKRAEAALRESEERQAFLLKLSDALRDLGDPIEVQAVASRVLGEHLDTDRAYYIESNEAKKEYIVARDWHRPGAPSHARRYPIEAWPMPWLVGGKTWVVRDVDTDPAMPDEQRELYRGNDIGAAVVVPLIKAGRLVATFVTNQRTPRAWTVGEVALVEETAQRTWAAVERARAEEALRESEKKYRELIDFIPAGVYACNADATLAYYNARALEMWGREPNLNDKAWMLCGSWRTYLPDGTLLKPRESPMAGVLATGEPVINRELKIERPDHTIIDILVNISALRNADGSISGAVNIFQDITVLKRAEAALRVSEERLRLALDASEMGTFVYHVEEDRGEPDARMLALFGLPESGILNLSAALARMIHPDDRADYAEAVVRSTDPQGDGTLREEIRVVHPDGSVRWVAVTAQTVFEGQPPRVKQMYGVAADATERKRAEEALRESEERLQKALSIETVGVIFFDLEGVIHDANEAFQRMSGYSREDCQSGKVRWDEATPPEFMEASRKAIDELLTRGQNTPYEKQYIRKDGSRFWALFAGKRLNETEGVEFVIDMTERKRAEEQVRESEARFRTLADAVPQLIWTNDADGWANYFNQRWYDYSGLSYEQSAGLGWQVIVHPGDGPVSVERWQRALAAGQVFESEYRLRRADGTYRWHIGRNVPLRDESGHVVGWFGTATDIEELKQAEAAVRQSEERFRLLVEGARDYAMFLLDPLGCITFWSAGAERLFDYTEAEAIGQSGAIIFTPDDRERGAVEHELRIALTEGRAEDRRWHVRKDGSRLFIDGVQIRLDDEQGELRGFVKIGRDATAQREAEEALQRAHAELESRVEERTSELAAANHLLRQEIVQRRQLEAQRAALMERIITAQESERQRIAHELHDTLGQFLSALGLRLSMVQSLDGILPTVSDELVRLRTLAGQIDQEVDRLTMELRPPALEHLGLADALSSYAQEWTATSGVGVDVLATGLDGMRLPSAIETTAYRIVQEALTNVLKHAQASSVSVIVERRAGELRVIIEDDGVGFEPSPGAGDGVGGRQVGLIGMAERATLAGGELTIESAPGAGTSIYLHIPLDDDTSRGTGGARG